VLLVFRDVSVHFSGLKEFFPCINMSMKVRASSTGYMVFSVNILGSKLLCLCVACWIVDIILIASCSLHSHEQFF
jgi:hypothetical protein